MKSQALNASKVVNLALFLNPFFLGTTCTILTLKICLESPKHGLLYFLKALF
jgi:hypothetical protein